MRKLFVLLLIATTAFANEQSYRSLQSGTPSGPTPLHDRGLHGEGQVIAILDTGLDYDVCYFAEANNALPPINTGSPTTGLAWRNVDPARRKVIAYDFLYSCDQYPGARGCEDPTAAGVWDNQGHGTHAAGAAAGDYSRPIAHDNADAIATGAKLVIQDAGYIGGDNCSQRPGIGCPVNLTPILEQAYRQGARIHSNSWGDRQGTPAPLNPPTANYPQAARDVDAFVYANPDMLVVFNTGNGNTNTVPSTLSAPGSAKNTLQVGGTRSPNRGDDVLYASTLIGPTRDGRIKPDLVAAAYVVAGDAKIITGGRACSVTNQPGTSWSAPTVAGAAALVRQYYTDGFYPSGAAKAADRFTPTAALLKATLIASARAVPWRDSSSGLFPAKPVPSNEQGFGFPVLDDALYLSGDRTTMRVVDARDGLAASGTQTMRLNVRAGAALKAVLVWTDPPGSVRAPSDPTPQLVNDLDLRVTG
ncbi:MAG TPA: S8 family serine peptidase, partial [Thermoanaerobaculia bacterium]